MVRVDIVIKTKHDNDPMEMASYRGEYIETEDVYLMSYIENLYDNLIVIHKSNEMITVEKQSTVSCDPYYSKLIFEKHKKHRCSIEVEGYTAFVNIETTNTLIEKGSRQMRIKLDYNIEGSKTYVEIIAEII